MSWGYVQSNLSTPAGTQASISCAFGSSVGVGDLVAVAVSAFAAAGKTISVGDGTSNVYAVSNSYLATSNLGLWLYTGIATTGGLLNVTVTPSSSLFIAIAVADFAPGGTVTADGTAVVHATTGTALASGSFTTAGASDLILGVGQCASSGQTWTNGTGFTIAQSWTGASNHGSAFALEYALNVAAGSQNPALGASVTGAWAMIGSGFNATSSGLIVPVGFEGGFIENFDGGFVP